MDSIIAAVKCSDQARRHGSLAVELSRLCERLARAEGSEGEVFAQLDRLVAAVDPADGQAALQHPMVERWLELVRQRRAEHEFRLERLEADEALRDPCPGAAVWASVARRYRRTAIDDAAFLQHAGGRTRCLVVGCGAFPSTALLLLSRTRLVLTCIDRSTAACDLARRVLEAAAPGGRWTVLQRSIEEMRQLTAFSMVFVTAQTEAWSSRDELQRRLWSAMASGATLVIRSGHGLGALYYPQTRSTGMPDATFTRIDPPRPGLSALAVISRRPGAEPAIVVPG